LEAAASESGGKKPCNDGADDSCARAQARRKSKSKGEGEGNYCNRESGE
jgi:hypothetical protein